MRSVTSLAPSRSRITGSSSCQFAPSCVPVWLGRIFPRLVRIRAPLAVTYQLSAKALDEKPDVVLMDLRMPLMGGVEAIRKITSEYPSARVLALTTYEGDADIRHALEAGARGYLLKDMLLSDVITAIRRVQRGERVIPTAVAVRLAEFPERSDLTDREVEILQLVARGFSNKDTAHAIGRTDETVKIHLKNIFTKLGVADRTEAVTVALARGLIHLE